MDFAKAVIFVTADMNENGYDDEPMSPREAVLHARNTISLTPAPGAHVFVDEGDMLSEAYFIILSTDELPE